MTGIETVIIGVVVFIVGQTLQRFVLEPIHGQRQLIGEIASNVIFLGNVGPVSPEYASLLLFPMEPADASRAVRSQAARLRASLWTIPLYGLWAKIRLVYSRDTILDASRNMIGWSNAITRAGPPNPVAGPDTYRQKISTLLRLPTE